MSVPGISIREFAESDWPATEALLREVLADSESYMGDPSMSAEDARRYWLYDRHTVVAELDGKFAGSAHMGPNRPAQGSHVANASFIVARPVRGRGVGRALGEYAVDWLRQAGFRSIQFNAVVQTNVASRRLWESLGFRIVGTIPGAFRRGDGEYTGLHVMYLPLVED